MSIRHYNFLVLHMLLQYDHASTLVGRNSKIHVHAVDWLSYKYVVTC